MPQIDLFSDDSVAKVIPVKFEFGVMYSVFSNGYIIYTSPFLKSAQDFAAEFNSFLQL